MNSPAIPGDTLGTAHVVKAPVTGAECSRFEQTVIVSEAGLKYLRPAGPELEDQLKAGLDVRYTCVGSQPHLTYYLSSSDGQLDFAYLAAVPLPFGQGMKNTCKACYNQVWLDHQQIARCPAPARKNKTDKVSSPSHHISWRYLIGFSYPIAATIKPFLSKKGQSAGEVETMSQTWFKQSSGRFPCGSRHMSKQVFFKSP